MSLDQFEQQTPRVHARPVDPDDPDGEMSPGTAFAMVEQPEPAPNMGTVEGMIASLGKIGSGVGPGSSTRVGRQAYASQRLLVLIVALPFLVFLVVYLLNR